MIIAINFAIIASPRILLKRLFVEVENWAKFEILQLETIKYNIQSPDL